MSTVGDIAVITAVLADIINMFYEKGIEINLADLDVEIAKAKAQKDAVNKKLGINQ